MEANILLTRIVARLHDPARTNFFAIPFNIITTYIPGDERKVINLCDDTESEIEKVA